MLWTLPFLVLVVVLAPAQALASRRGQSLAAAAPPELPSIRALAVQALVAQGILLGSACLALRAPRVSVEWRSAIDVTNALAALAILGAFLVVASLESRRPLDPHDALRHKLSEISPADPWWLAVMIVAAIVEELAYRGVLTGVLAEHLGAWPAALVSALCFGLGHATQGWPGFAASAAFGLAMQWLVAMSGGFALAAFVHLAYDLGATTLGRRAARREARASDERA